VDATVNIHNPLTALLCFGTPPRINSSNYTINSIWLLSKGALLSKGPITAVVMCKYLAFKGAQSNCCSGHTIATTWNSAKSEGTASDECA